MATRTKRKRKTSTKYDLCCVSTMQFSYPAAPYRVYVASSRNGLIVGRHEVAAFETMEEAERWLRQHCRHWRLCDSP
jgi:hypothetical protein